MVAAAVAAASSCCRASWLWQAMTTTTMHLSQLMQSVNEARCGEGCLQQLLARPSQTAAARQGKTRNGRERLCEQGGDVQRQNIGGRRGRKQQWTWHECRASQRQGGWWVATEVPTKGAEQTRCCQSCLVSMTAVAQLVSHKSRYRWRVAQSLVGRSAEVPPIDPCNLTAPNESAKQH